MNRGVVLALSAYIFWGIHPIYWKLLKHVDSVEIVSHRIFWSFIFFVIIISFRKSWMSLFNKVKTSQNKWILFVPAFLIGSNWAIYIWAVTTGYIIETSLGYFICPLISVLLGVIFLHEKLRRIQWIAVVVAASGVLVMTFGYGQFPWISLYLAVTWGTYGLLRKRSPLGPVEGLMLETSVMSIPALVYLIFLFQSGSHTYLRAVPTSLLLMGTGIISGLPLLVFIAGSRLINLSLIGILQYIYPTMIFLIGYLIYHESMDQGKLTGFSFIWIAILLYIIGDVHHRRFRRDN
ncbi:EamA family transporter RarD [candidate division KSB1 bacterium]|nr:EamA family transporter RarD [candidate division KSB1 bacterium]